MEWGTGTTAYVDPVNEPAGMRFSQRMMAAPSSDFDAFRHPRYAGADGWAAPHQYR